MLKKYFIKAGFEALTALLAVSIKDEKVKSIVDVLLLELTSVVNVMTDDDLDNTKQLKELLAVRLYPMLKQLASVALTDKLTQEQQYILNIIINSK